MSFAFWARHCFRLGRYESLYKIIENSSKCRMLACILPCDALGIFTAVWWNICEWDFLKTLSACLLHYRDSHYHFGRFFFVWRSWCFQPIRPYLRMFPASLYYILFSCMIDRLVNACTKSGSLRFSQFSGCWLILSVYIIMSFDFPFVRLFGVR